MPRYFFDHHYEADITLDDEGIDLADAAAAKKYALEALAQTIMDSASRDPKRVAIDVRDDKGGVWRASAAIVVEELYGLQDGRGRSFWRKSALVILDYGRAPIAFYCIPQRNNCPLPEHRSDASMKASLKGALGKDGARERPSWLSPTLPSSEHVECVFERCAGRGVVEDAPGLSRRRRSTEPRLQP